ncbi:MAG: hypothetical protein HRU25_15655 [Psychrobium sp.]|nr:hypothetical protein [Psychrobium sp.]
MASNLIDKDEYILNFEKDLTTELIEQLKQDELTEIAALKLKNISDYIYVNYSKLKQAQDEKWSSSYVTKLKASGVANLELLVVSIVAKKLTIDSATASLSDDVLSKIQGSNKAKRKTYAEYMLTKLVNIAVRTEWAESCVIEGRTAIVENREPIFPLYEDNV